jgi:hypothetical protein
LGRYPQKLPQHRGCKSSAFGLNRKALFHSTPARYIAGTEGPEVSNYNRNEFSVFFLPCPLLKKRFFSWPEDIPGLDGNSRKDPYMFMRTYFTPQDIDVKKNI